MNQRIALPLLLCVALVGGLRRHGQPGWNEIRRGGDHGDEPVGTRRHYRQLENIQVDDKYKLGVGTAVGAVAGGLLGAGVGDSTGATVAGAVNGRCGRHLCREQNG